ncbi:carboxypeptidase-like regulatory domain-containing protein [Patescibacteria group bacterium]|nr:carboxypeptidase-like regulatory domain-containing protein [Patescibacteria group bacterium]
MKIKTAILSIFLILGFLFLTNNNKVIAQSFEAGGGDVNVNANINQDLYSQLDVTPGTVEAREPALVNIHMLTSDGSPKAGRTLVIYVNGNSTGVTITQPPVSDSNGLTSGSIYSSVPGTFEVCARDTTEGINIYLLDCETLYVVPVTSPTLLSEPQYTQGLLNTLAWNMSGTGTYTYLIQSSTSSTFSTIFAQSNWISAKAYEFHGLTDGQIYFYRVKAKNSYSAESAWSNSVYSVQDNTKPTITLLSLDGLGTNNTQVWEAQDVLTFKLRVKDNTGVASKSFWCVARDDSPQDCLNTESFGGDIWTITVKLGDLEHDSNYYLYPQYTFCAQALDVVGNVRRVCDITLNVPEPGGEEEPEPPVPPVIPIVEQIKDTVNEILDNSKQFFENTIGRINPNTLEQLSITVAIANILLGMGIVLNGLGTLPYVLLQLFLAISSFLGFRTKGHPTGYVYDSITKAPIPQCIVRIFDGNGTLVWTDVTDGNGYFKSTRLKSGEYSIRVAAQDYEFPSKIVFGKNDFPLENVYLGQEFYVSKDTIPNFSIPMDRVEMSDLRFVFSQFTFVTKLIWKFFHMILFFVGLMFSLYALSVNGSWYNYVILILYIPSLFMLVTSFISKRERYGLVRDTKGKRLSGIVLGLKDREFDRLISKRVTDEFGRFRFFVYPGNYDLEILSSEWKIVNGKALTDIMVKKEDIMIRDIVIERVVQEEKRPKKVKVEEVLQPLEEL